jgi:gas vesicle protein
VKGEGSDGLGTGGILLVFVAGALAGAAVALLLAPRSGASTRARLGEAAGQAGARAARARQAVQTAAAAGEKAFREALRGLS